jgi:hypothetical protein
VVIDGPPSGRAEAALAGAFEAGQIPSGKPIRKPAKMPSEREKPSNCYESLVT